MMYKIFLLAIVVYCLVLSAASTAIAGSLADDWQLIGKTEENPSTGDYPYYYYKLLQVNSAAHRYNSIIDVSVEGNADAYNAQGTYRIRVAKYVNTTARFDGLEIQCSSGNPAAATFYIYNDALWVRSNFKWGNIYYRTDGLFSGGSPITSAPYGQTLTAPTGAMLVTSNAVKYDFDTNNYTWLPAMDANGNMALYKNTGLLVDSKVGMGLADQLNYDGKTQPHYGFQWTMDSWNTSGPTYWLSGYGGLKFFTAGTPKMVVAGNGNVGIGTTNPQAKLAVNGDIYGKRVKVTIAAASWPDYVFQSDYQLPPLQEVEKYVKANQHLQGIPAAAEIEKDGLDLGDMNKKLLQKVEELTLYLIEQQKTIKALKEKDALQEVRLQALEKK